MCKHRWTICALVTILTCSYVFGDHAFKDISKVIEDLEYIEAKEGAARSNDPNAGIDEIKALIDYCGVEVNLDPDDVTLNERLAVWSKCSAVWNWQMARAEWDFETNITPETEESLNKITVAVIGNFQKLAVLASDLQNAPDIGSLDAAQQRQIRLMAMDDTPKKQEDKEKLSKLQTTLQNIYSNALVDGKPMEPDLIKIMASSRDPKDLEYYWLGWRNVTGKLMKDDYEAFVAALNGGATENGFADYGEAWLQGQFGKVVDIEHETEILWQEVKPLYQQLHAYVRRKLETKYPEYKDIYDIGGIPAHLTGNMWAQEWNNIYDLVKPYPEVDEPDYDTALKDKGYTAKGLFDLAEEFYTSIGLFEMPPKFHENSMIERPPDRDVVCHASASDFYLNDDVRIKMCTEVNIEYLHTIHHEMGHVEYFIAYKNQPTVFRTGANSGFHEAIGDTISLSVLTPKHMEALNLITKNSPSLTKSTDGLTEQNKRDINGLLKVALSKIAFLPFGYLIDKWRWDVFAKRVNKSQYNTHWWNLRNKYQGIYSPVPRSEEDFDPGAKFHIPSNSPYICYFVSFILQFQFYESMCKAAGQLSENEPLHQCDYYQSKEAGKLLREMMELGGSQPWNETLNSMTGSPHINTSSILKYFRPLHDWLDAENKRNANPVGWTVDSDRRQSVSSISTLADIFKSARNQQSRSKAIRLSKNHRKNLDDNFKNRYDARLSDIEYLIKLIQELRNNKFTR